MFKYGRMQKKILLQLVCGSHGACLDSMLPGVQVTAGLEFFSDIVTPCFNRPCPFAGPYSGIVYHKISKVYLHVNSMTVAIAIKLNELINVIKTFV